MQSLERSIVSPSSPRPQHASQSATQLFAALELIASEHLQQGPAYEWKHQHQDNDHENDEEHEAHQAAAQCRPDRWYFSIGMGCSSGHAAGSRGSSQDLQHSCRADMARRGAPVAHLNVRTERSPSFSAAPGVGACSRYRWWGIGAALGLRGSDRRRWASRSGRRNGPCCRAHRVAEFRAALRTCGASSHRPGVWFVQ